MSRGGVIPYYVTYPPGYPISRKQTHACENITFSTLFAGGKISNFRTYVSRSSPWRSCRSRGRRGTGSRRGRCSTHRRSPGRPRVHETPGPRTRAAPGPLAPYTPLHEHRGSADTRLYLGRMQRNENSFMMHSNLLNAKRCSDKRNHSNLLS